MISIDACKVFEWAKIKMWDLMKFFAKIKGVCYISPSIMIIILNVNSATHNR